jgi:hypothetical protein
VLCSMASSKVLCSIASTIVFLFHGFLHRAVKHLGKN